MEKSDILIVEGPDDVYVINAILKREKLAESLSMDIIPAHSVEQAVRDFRFRIEKTSNTVKRIAIIIDADEKYASRWDSVRLYLLSTKAYKVPRILPAGGLVLEPTVEGFPRVGAWIMPDNHLDGRLEDFMMLMADENDLLLQKAESVLCELEQEQLNLYKKCHHSKAKVHTWLAWQEEPGIQMGAAVTRHYFQTNKEVCKLFLNWLKEMFS